MTRTHTCNQLRKDHVGSTVTLCGWVNSRRDHGGVIFVDLRDRYGITQIVFNPDCPDFSDAEHLRREDVLEVTGKVLARGEGLVNPNLETGEIEVEVTQLTILSKAQTPPIEVDDRKVVSDDLRLKYRFLDLRRPIMQRNLLARHKAMQAVHKELDSQGFLYVETPLLVKSTPEGARDYVVPSRVNPGKFYALPQSPQLYKQILMASGCDRYYQFAKCLRDEDLRSDRQPEHTQIDLEMSFPTLEQLYEVGETIMKAIFKEIKQVELPTPFPRISFAEAMEKYGTDKPDTRFEMFLHDVTDIVRNSDFTVFRSVVENGGIVKCINPPKNIGRKELDELIKFSQQAGAKGMAWMRATPEGFEGNIAKFFSQDILAQIKEKTGAQPDTVLLFIADTKHTTHLVLDKLRREIGKRQGLIDEDKLNFVWVTDFPFFEWNEDEEKWEAGHNPFSMLTEETIQYLEDDPGKVYCKQFDLVLNGVEIASGSIRNTNPELQTRVLRAIGISEEETQEKFGFLLEAFKYGVPPHGGMGIGFDRIVALALGLDDIREVIAFPKNKSAQCPMDGSPSQISKEQLKELFIDLKLPRSQ
ncbi:aspartate--tRNA ligase [Candidatus Woesearchaeota archaeon]|nr:MAG: aspartate--tRNA ligase [Candidatus Woesearchaeota archaeon]